MPGVGNNTIAGWQLAESITDMFHLIAARLPTLFHPYYNAAKTLPRLPGAIQQWKLTSMREKTCQMRLFSPAILRYLAIVWIRIPYSLSTARKANQKSILHWPKAVALAKMGLITPVYAAIKAGSLPFVFVIVNPSICQRTSAH